MNSGVSRGRMHCLTASCTARFRAQHLSPVMRPRGTDNSLASSFSSAQHELNLLLRVALPHSSTLPEHTLSQEQRDLHLFRSEAGVMSDEFALRVADFSVGDDLGLLRERDVTADPTRGAFRDRSWPE